MNSAIIVAAGLGSRLGGLKKQFLEIGGKTVLRRSVEKFIQIGICDIVISTRTEDIDFVERMFLGFKNTVRVVSGGKTRQQSVKNAFDICDKDGVVLIHDAARPFVETAHIVAVMRAAEEMGAAALGVFSTETVKYVENNLITKTIDRKNVCLIQTPQAFSKEIYRQSLKISAKDHTDDCQLVEKAGYDIKIVEGSKNNIKITTIDDLKYAEFLAEIETKNLKVE